MSFLHSVRKGVIIVGIIGMVFGITACEKNTEEPSNKGGVWICPSCSNENKTEVKFCAECGTPKPDGDANDVPGTKRRN